MHLLLQACCCVCADVTPPDVLCCVSCLLCFIHTEMVKSDEQMARIKDRLMYEQQQIDQATER